MNTHQFSGLTNLYNNWDNVITVAHRGASGCYPENTILSMRKAIQCGADMIEFDLRASKDGIPILLHDNTLNRTSDMQGKPEEYSLAQLRCGNFSHYIYGTDYKSGKEVSKPVYRSMKIPTFEDILQQFRGQTAMNIQVYAEQSVIKEICHLYKQYQMYDQGYLTLATMKDIDFVKSIDPKIEICYTPGWEDRSSPENLKLCKKIGCRFVQPVADFSDPCVFDLCNELKLRTIVFRSNTEDMNYKLVKLGATGILSDRVDILIDSLKEMKKYE